MKSDDKQTLILQDHFSLNITVSTSDTKLWP